MRDMKTIYAALALVGLAFTAHARDTREVLGSPAAVFLLAPHLAQVEATSDIAVTAATVGSGQLVLDVIDGKAATAAVAMNLAQALAAAREAARQEGRTLVVPATLQFHEVARFERDARPVGFVTVGAPSPELERVVELLRSRRGLYSR
jgi:hypothetical protein